MGSFGKRSDYELSEKSEANFCRLWKLTSQQNCRYYPTISKINVKQLRRICRVISTTMLPTATTWWQKNVEGLNHALEMAPGISELSHVHPLSHPLIYVYSTYHLLTSLRRCRLWIHYQLQFRSAISAKLDYSISSKEIHLQPSLYRAHAPPNGNSS
jgi:hypothetical protein